MSKPKGKERKINVDSKSEEADLNLAALIDSQLDDIVCGGWSRGTWVKINPN